MPGASFDGWHGGAREAICAWKFARNPHGPARIWVADDGGRIAGCYILNPVMLRVGEAAVHGAQAVDAAVSPDYRGRGVFTDLARAALTDAANDGIALVFAFPSAGAFGGQVRVGFRPQFAIPKAYRPLLWPPRRWTFDGLTRGEVSAFDARFDIFSKHARAGEIALQRDADYLQWRYYDHPAKTYDTITCERHGQICGYCVLMIGPRRKKLSQGYVVDFQVLPDSGPAARFLACHALERLRSLGAQVAMSWERPSGPEQEALASYGFSSRYASIRRRLMRPSYIDLFIAYDHQREMPQEPQPVRSLDEPPRWSLVPGDLDDI